jgi:ribosomal-protein-alanine N-acetyltransferase
MIAVKNKARTYVRWLTRADLPAVLRIEKSSFETPWKEDDFLSGLRPRTSRGMVAERDGKIVGFMIYGLHKNAVDLLDFAVAESHRRSGVGRTMVERLIGKLSEDRRSYVHLTVRETNLGALLFFREMGFKCILTLCDHYIDCDDDGYLMTYRYPSDAADDGMVNFN